MANVPDTTTFSFTDVTAIIDTTNMVTAFATSASNAFDSRYTVYPANSLLRFRNYGAAISTPVITLVGANVITITQSNPYTEFGATATDSIWGDLTGSIVTTGTVNTATIGSYVVHYNVTNPNGTPAVEVTRTIIVRAESTAIVCLYGAADYGSPPNYSPVILSAAGGYTEACLSSLGMTIGGTSALSSICFVNSEYSVTIYDNGTPSSTGDFTGKRYSELNSGVLCDYLKNFNNLCFSGTSCVINDQTRSLCVIYGGAAPTVNALCISGCGVGVDGVDAIVYNSMQLSDIPSGSYSATFGYQLTKPSTGQYRSETVSLCCNGVSMFTCTVSSIVTAIDEFCSNAITFTVLPTDYVVMFACATSSLLQTSYSQASMFLDTITPISGSYVLGSPNGVSVCTCPPSVVVV